MSDRRIKGGLAIVFAALCVLAWIDGGEEPLHPIEQAVEVPGRAR
ncbi:MAG: hypothetical protein WC692_10635 [Erythrobacter sp.]|jgi:hypothetical protein